MILNLRVQSGNTFSRLRAARREDCISAEQNYPKVLLQEKGQLRRIKGSKTRPIPSRKTDRLPNLRLLPGHWRQVVLYPIMPTYLRLLFGEKTFRNSIQDGTKFFVNGAIPTWWHLGKSVQIKNMRVWDKTVFELYNLGIHQKKAGPDYHRLKTMVKRSIEHELGSRNFEAGMGEMSETFWSRIRENNFAFTKDKENVGNGKPTGSVRKETRAVFGTVEISVQKLRHSLLLLQNIRRKHKVGRIYRCRKVPGGKVRLGKYLVNRARNIFKVPVRIHLVKSGIPWSACSTSPRMDPNSGISASSHTAGSKSSPAKGLKRMSRKVQ